MTDFPIGIDPQGRIQLVAVQIRAAGVPDFLNRWLTLTPAELAERDAVLAKIVEAYRNRRTRMKTPIDGSKEGQVRELRLQRVAGEKKPKAVKAAVAKQTLKTAEASAPANPEAEPVLEPDTKESVMKTKKKGAAKSAKKSAKAKAIVPVKSKAKTAVRRGGSKMEKVAELLQRAGGTTTKEVLKATGWPTVSMPQQAKAAGLTLRKEKKKGEPTRYYGTAKAAAA